MMQSTNVQELHKKAPESPIPPLIIGSTNMGNQDPPLPNAESMNEEKPSPRSANSIVMQTEDNLVAPSEQASRGRQVRYHKANARTSLAHKDRPTIKVRTYPRMSRTTNWTVNKKRYLISTQTTIPPYNIWQKTKTTIAMVSMIMMNAPSATIVATRRV